MIVRTTAPFGVRLPVQLLQEWRTWAAGTGLRAQDLAEALVRFGLAHRQEVLDVARAMVGIGSRVRSLRVLAGVGSRELDRLAGLREGHVAMIELRSGDVESRTALAMASVFGVTVEFLSNGEGEGPSEEAVKAAVQKARTAKASSAPTVARAELP